MAKTILRNTTQHDITLCVADGHDVFRVDVPCTVRNRESGLITGGFSQEIDSEFIENARAKSPVIEHWLRVGHLIMVSPQECQRELKARAAKKGKTDEQK